MLPTRSHSACRRSHFMTSTVQNLVLGINYQTSSPTVCHCSLSKKISTPVYSVYHVAGLILWNSQLDKLLNLSTGFDCLKRQLMTFLHSQYQCI